MATYAIWCNGRQAFIAEELDRHETDMLRDKGFMIMEKRECATRAIAKLWFESWAVTAWRKENFCVQQPSKGTNPRSTRTTCFSVYTKRGLVA